MNCSFIGGRLLCHKNQSLSLIRQQWHILHRFLKKINWKFCNVNSFLKSKSVFVPRGGSRIFSRGGGRFFKIFRKFCRPLLSQITKKTLFWPNFLHRIKFFEKQAKKAFLGSFWKTLTIQLRFFGAHSHFRISIYWRPRRLGKMLGSASQKGMSLNSTKGAWIPERSFAF